MGVMEEGNGKKNEDDNIAVGTAVVERQSRAESKSPKSCCS